MEMLFLIASFAALSVQGTLALNKQYRLSFAAFVVWIACMVGYGLTLWNII